MKLLLVEWDDAHSGSRWEPLEDLKARTLPLSCRSVGWLVEETKTALLLVPHISGENNQQIMSNGSGEIEIPKSCITKRVPLKEGRRV